jgi:hypothetical protein
VQDEFFHIQIPNPDVTLDDKQTLDPLEVKLLHEVYTSRHYGAHVQILLPVSLTAKHDDSF